ncbi:GSU2403 family nucleotidyltransferase fold protein [Ramlibacter sp.]|uniref:GSU2403 family nucleotidyltransferase fold protein n=1 Tax=Ramlibacter sp. TaxID=1917967 RepID=UPI003D12C36B
MAELDENQLRELVNARAAWRNYRDATREALQVKGSMAWKEVRGRTYLIRKSASGAQKSLGAKDAGTEAMYASFQARKARAQARLKAMKQRVEEQRKLNRVYRVGRTPAVVVRVLNALDSAGLADKFMVIGTHALYAYEAAAGVLVDSSAMATRDLDLLFDARKRVAFITSLSQGEHKSLIGVLQKADATFRVIPDQLQTAVNDDGFEVDLIRRKARDGDSHPMRMSDDENDFWAVEIDQREKIQSGRKFEHLVVAPNGEMASMRTLHPLDFIRLKRDLSQRPGRDPLKAPKDRLQAQVVQQLWDDYLRHLHPANADEKVAGPGAGSGQAEALPDPLAG